MRPLLTLSGLFASGLLCLLLLAGCEEDITAVLGTDQPFSMYGVLTPQADTQRVRVFTIEERLEPTPPTPLDVQFTSTDAATGEVTVWRDALIQEENGMNAHVFWAPFTALHSRAYRLEVAYPDGMASRVDAVVPPLTALELPGTLDVPPALFPILVAGEAPNLLRIEVTYRVKYIGGSGIETDDFIFSYQGKQERVVRGWLIQVNTTQDRRFIESLLKERGPFNANVGAKIIRLTIRLIVASADWSPPGGVFDLETLVQPGTMDNVENGFGFVGAGYRLEQVWIPLDTLVTG